MSKRRQCRLHSEFLSILPRIKTHARIYFRHVRCRHRKADCVSETVALAWKWFIRLAERGKDACTFPSALASLAAKAVRSGRRVCGQLKSKDAMNELTQQKRSFVVGKLPDHATLSTNPLAEALQDNTRTPPPDAAAFRCDWPAWLKQHSRRDRRLIREMAMGHRTQDLAQRFQLSQARISQRRRELHDDWERFTADPAEA
ncbi:MAG: hypothetical protein JNM56_13190 [Planctomycetia bacterium]|nr:hypothetical protein [Planctomycetia bacterium]